MPEVVSKKPVTAGLVELPGVLESQGRGAPCRRSLALRGKPVDIDASHVERLGGQCLQVLLSAAKTWKADKTSFVVINRSSDFAESLARLGVSAAEFHGRRVPDEQDRSDGR